MRAIFFPSFPQNLFFLLLFHLSPFYPSNNRLHALAYSGDRPYSFIQFQFVPFSIRFYFLSCLSICFLRSSFLPRRSLSLPKKLMARFRASSKRTSSTTTPNRNCAMVKLKVPSHTRMLMLTHAHAHTHTFQFSSSVFHTPTCTHMHTHAHTCTNTHTHELIHTHQFSIACSHTQTQTHTHVITFTHTDTS